MELLGQVPLFADLDQACLRSLAFSGVRRDLVAGEVLFNKGDPARTGFLVSYGVIELAVSPEKGSHRERCNRGYLIGEMPLFVDTKRPATARATNASTVTEISRHAMKRMLEEHPEAAGKLYARLNERLGGTLGDLQRVRQSLLAIGG